MAVGVAGSAGRSYRAPLLPSRVPGAGPGAYRAQPEKPDFPSDFPSDFSGWTRERLKGLEPAGRFVPRSSPAPF